MLLRCVLPECFNSEAGKFILEDRCFKLTALKITLCKSGLNSLLDTIHTCGMVS